MNRIVPVVGLFVLAFFPLASESQNPLNRDVEARTSSIYTDISPRGCQLVKVHTESGGSVQECPGPAGYKLFIEDDDSRMSATVVTPEGQRHPLNYWQVITHNFSSLGAKAEWRVTRRQGKTVPTALIIRVNAIENPDTSSATSYLAVAKITDREICVTDKIKPGPAANEEARRAADASANK